MRYFAGLAGADALRFGGHVRFFGEYQLLGCSATLHPDCETDVLSVELQTSGGIRSIYTAMPGFFPLVLK